MGVLFLNQSGFIHHDLKEQNIMIDKNKRAKIIDFGSIIDKDKAIKEELKS